MRMRDKIFVLMLVILIISVAMMAFGTSQGRPDIHFEFSVTAVISVLAVLVNIILTPKP